MDCWCAQWISFVFQVKRHGCSESDVNELCPCSSRSCLMDSKNKSPCAWLLLFECVSLKYVFRWKKHCLEGLLTWTVTLKISESVRSSQRSRAVRPSSGPGAWTKLQAFLVPSIGCLVECWTSLGISPVSSGVFCRSVGITSLDSGCFSSILLPVDTVVLAMEALTYIDVACWCFASWCDLCCRRAIRFSRIYSGVKVKLTTIQFIFYFYFICLF